jgi:hypothetical protein
VFARHTCPGDLTRQGKLRILIRPTALLGRHRPWQSPTEAFLGWPIAYDFMQHPPFAFPHWLYHEVRQHAVDLHGVSLEEYVRKRPPRSFSEFNVLGGFAYERRRDRFSWIDTSLEDMGEPLCRWYWSWGGIDAEIRAEIEQLLA